MCPPAKIIHFLHNAMAYDMEIGYQKWWPKAIGHYTDFLKGLYCQKNEQEKGFNSQ